MEKIVLLPFFTDEGVCCTDRKLELNLHYNSMNIFIIVFNKHVKSKIFRIFFIGRNIQCFLDSNLRILLLFFHISSFIMLMVYNELRQRYQYSRRIDDTHYFKNKLSIHRIFLGGIGDCIVISDLINTCIHYIIQCQLA